MIRVHIARYRRWMSSGICRRLEKKGGEKSAGQRFSLVRDDQEREIFSCNGAVSPFCRMVDGWMDGWTVGVLRAPSGFRSLSGTSPGIASRMDT